MGETIAVLFVFFILIIMGFVFYANVIKGSLVSEKEEVSQFASVGIAQRVMFLPEIQCSEDNIVTDSCIDSLKLRAAEKVMGENKAYYFDLFEYSDINISQIYPQISPDGDKINLYSKTLDGFKNKFVTNVPVSLYAPSTRKYSFGVLTIETSSK